MTNKLQEVYAFTHKDIKVYVKIDYANNKISLVDWCGQSYQAKKWLFNDRGVEYMNGWLTILEAMGEAIKDAKKRYEADLAENSKFLEKEVIKGLKNKK